MSKIIVSEFVSLDGVIQAPGGPTEDTEGGFAYGGWAMGNGDDGEFVTKGIQSVGAFLLGRVTYQIFAAYWPQQTEENNKIAQSINSKPKYVVSTTLTEADTQLHGTRLINRDVVQALSNLHQQPGDDIMVIGSSKLVQTLTHHNLVDEYRLIQYPLLLGRGKKLFREDGPKTDLRLVSSQTTPSGLLILTYQPRK